MTEQWSSVLCLMCKHFDFKNYGICAAFPEGIPNIVASNEVDHFTPLKNQSNDIVYEPIKKKKKKK